MLSQNRYHRLFPIVSILLVVLPSFVHNDQLNSYPRNYQKQARQLQTQSDSSVSSSEVSYDTKNFDDDSVPSAFNWDSPGVFASSDNEVDENGEANDLTAQPHRLKQRRRHRKRKRNKKRNRNRDQDNDEPNRNRHRQKEYDYYDDYSYDRDDGYSAPDAGYSAPSDGYGSPKAPAYSAPAPSYEAPAPSYSAPSYEAPSSSYSSPSYDSGGGDDGKDFLNSLAAFLPIALFLAALFPNLIVVNGRKKRSLIDGNEVMLDQESEYAFPFIKQINDMGITNLYKNKDCQQKLFCEMANYGSRRYAPNDSVDLETPNLIQKTFNFVSNSSPNIISDMFGTSMLFEAVRSGNCEIFKCSK